MLISNLRISWASRGGSSKVYCATDRDADESYHSSTAIMIWTGAIKYGMSDEARFRERVIYSSLDRVEFRSPHPLPGLHPFDYICLTELEQPCL